MKKHFMANFETGYLTTSKTEVDLKNRVKIGPSDFGDDFENFRKFHEHFCRKFKRAVLTNGGKRLFKRFKFVNLEE